MSTTDPLGDMLTRIRNGQMASMPVVECPASSFRKRVLEAMPDLGVPFTLPVNCRNTSSIADRCGTILGKAIPVRPGAR